MRVICKLVVAILSPCFVLSQGICLHPPCPGHEEHQVHVPESESIKSPEQCCLETKDELAQLHRNVTALWFTITEFREVVARHMHHLHQHQVTMFSHQMAGDVSENNRHGRRKHHSHRHRHRHGHANKTGDPFDGLDVVPPPAAFGRPPIMRNPQDFDFAVCHMRPNPSIPESQVHGIVYMSQKKNSETVYIHLRLSGFEGASAEPQQQMPVELLHGFHVHEKPDLSGGCDTAGPHYNPFNVSHGGPDSLIRHLGDFGNVASDEEGAINEVVSDEVASLRGNNNIIGRPLVVHAVVDDLGSHPTDPGSQTTGNSGARLACCIIEELEVERKSNQEHRHEHQIDEQQLQHPAQEVKI